MKTTKLQLVFCFLLSAFLLMEIISCKKDNSTTPATPMPTPTPTPFATIGGSTEGSWTVTCDSTASTGITVKGSCNGYVLGIYMHTSVTDTGTYPLSPVNSCQATYKYNNDSAYTCSGELYVNYFNKSKKTISATFKFDAEPIGSGTGIVFITNGVFTNQVW